MCMRECLKLVLETKISFHYKQKMYFIKKMIAQIKHDQQPCTVNLILISYAVIFNSFTI